MSKTLTGRQVLALLAQDEVPEIEVETMTCWTSLVVRNWSIDDLRTTGIHFRIKPTPKPDVSFDLIVRQVDAYPEIHYPEHWELANIRFTFDGETNKLKSAEVL